MYFVSMVTPDNKISVIGGTVNANAAKKLAEKRAKHKLDWQINEEGNGFISTLTQGTATTIYKIRERS